MRTDYSNQPVKTLTPDEVRAIQEKKPNMAFIREENLVEETEEPKEKVDRNITLDMSIQSVTGSLMENIPMAIVPAAILRRMVNFFADSMVHAGVESIIEPHVANLRAAKTVEEAMIISLMWVHTREIVNTIKKGGWSAYEVK